LRISLTLSRRETENQGVPNYSPPVSRSQFPRPEIPLYLRVSTRLSQCTTATDPARMSDVTFNMSEEERKAKAERRAVFEEWIKPHDEKMKDLRRLIDELAVGVNAFCDSQSTTSSIDNQFTTTSTDTESHVPSDDSSWHPSDTSNSSEPYCPPTQDMSSLTSPILSDDVTTLESDSSSPKSHLSSTSTTDLSPTPKLKSPVDSPLQPHLVQSIQFPSLPEPEPPPCDRLLKRSPRYRSQPHMLDTDSEDEAKPRRVNMLLRPVSPDYDSSETDEPDSECSSESDHVSKVSGSQPHHNNNTQVASNGDYTNHSDAYVYDSDDANTGDQSESNDDDSSDHSDTSSGDLLSDY